MKTLLAANIKLLLLACVKTWPAERVRRSFVSDGRSLLASEKVIRKIYGPARRPQNLILSVIRNLSLYGARNDVYKTVQLRYRGCLPARMLCVWFDLVI